MIEVETLVIEASGFLDMSKEEQNKIIEDAFMCSCGINDGCYSDEFHAWMMIGNVAISACLALWPIKAVAWERIAEMKRA